MIRYSRFALVFRAVSLLFAIAGLLALLCIFNGRFRPATLAFTQLIPGKFLE